MIAPSKHVPVDRTLLAAGAVVLSALDRPRSVSALWERVRQDSSIMSYDWFLLSVSLLFALDAIVPDGDRLRRRR